MSSELQALTALWASGGGRRRDGGSPRPQGFPRTAEGNVYSVVLEMDSPLLFCLDLIPGNSWSGLPPPGSQAGIQLWGSQVHAKSPQDGESGEVRPLPRLGHIHSCQGNGAPGL